MVLQPHKAAAGRSQGQPQVPAVMIETDDYRVHFSDVHDADEIVVTFSHMFFASASYWGASFIPGTGRAALGIVSKRNAWYPSSLLALLPNVREITAEYRRTHVIGASMGGYAALKYGRLVRATAVAAFSPQWSIDPRDVGDFDVRFRDFFDPALNAAMAICAEDIAAPAAVFFDPGDPLDAEHFRRIERLRNDVAGVELRGYGHETVRAVIEADLSGRLFDLMGTGCASQLAKIMADPQESVASSMARSRTPSCWATDDAFALALASA